MKKCLYLDDIRIPSIVPKGCDQWIIVRSYEDFVNHIKENGIPDFISFDHDLADAHYQLSFSAWKNSPEVPNLKEKTGYECAKWLVEYCMDKDLDMCDFSVHSANPSGAQNILYLLNNFRRNRGQEPTGFKTYW